MLKELRINNLILVESAEISFGEGFNVLSGETGSGKSAIMSALSLILGERADISWIRHGAAKGVVEAVFDIDKHPQFLTLLEEGGIDHEPGDHLLIRREINPNAKNRTLINNQTVQLGLLKKVGDLLAEMVGQHANQRLLSVDQHREIIDIFGNIEADVATFKKSWEQENRIRHHLEDLVNSEAQRLRDIEVCRMELEELQEAMLKDGEDEALFNEYTLLSNTEELSSNAGSISQALIEGSLAILPILNKKRATFDQLSKLDPSLEELRKSYESVLLELQEISYTLTRYLSRIESNPSRIAEINDRLTLIARLKRKYGKSITEIHEYEAKTIQKLALLEKADTQIEDLTKELTLLENHNNTSANQLTESRKSAAKRIEIAIIQQLRALNMPKVEFYAEITHQKRNELGEDRIEFFLSPNVGEHKISIKDYASGGELSRLMLALQTLLAGKAQIPTLIFDEIDANIGGETASIVGEKLKEIGAKHQILCITHFPQVAKHAEHHFQISKVEKNGRTMTLVKTLDIKERKSELVRMSGKAL